MREIGMVVVSLVLWGALAGACAWFRGDVRVSGDVTLDADVVLLAQDAGRE